MSGCFSLTGLPDKLVPANARGQAFGLLEQIGRFGLKPKFKNIGLLETTPLEHGALLSVRGRRERN
jgi:hypothetical protein